MNNSDDPLRDLVKKQIIIFIQGCKNEKCLSPDCKNFIIKDAQLENIRKDDKQAL